MAAPSNTFQTYQAIGNREDLIDIIYNVSPTDRPFLTSIGRTKATATKHEWQTDALAAASTSNAVIDGDDATTDAVTPTTRLNNYCQIQDKVARVSGTQLAVNSAGRKDDLVYQVVKKTKELGNDMETAALKNGAAAVGSSTAPRYLAGILAWIATNDVIAPGDTTGASPTGDGTDTRTDGTQTALTEAMFKQALRLCWDSGGDPDTVLAGSFNKQVISGFTGGNTRYEEAGDRKAVAAIDVYESDFGAITIKPSRRQRSRDLFILQTDLWAASYLRPVMMSNLAKTGDSERRQVLVEWTLEARNEAGSGGVFDLTTS